MPDSPCLARCRSLHDAIVAKMSGKSVHGAGAKGRSVTYAEADVNDMIKLYQQLWRACPDAQAELPELKPLDQPVATRGRPAVLVGSGHV